MKKFINSVFVTGFILGIFIISNAGLNVSALNFGNWTYEVITGANGTDEIEITMYGGMEKHVTIPGIIDGKIVTSIGANAFSGNKIFQSVTIPEGVKEIKNNAFFNNVSLKRITFPNSLETIQYSAFYNCNKLSNIVLPNVSSIGLEAFSGCTSLMNVYFESDIQPVVNGNAFSSLPIGARAIIPDSTDITSNYVTDINNTWNNLIIKTESDFGINYSTPSIIVSANGINGNYKSSFEINLSKETLTVPADYTIRSYSLDGGKKWKKAKSEMFHEVNFPKFLDSGMKLALSDSDINPITKQPFENFNIVNFPVINARPKSPSLTVNYAIKADLTGATQGKWVLTQRQDNRTEEKEFTGNIEIGLTEVGKRVIDTKGYGLMPPGGISVLTYREFDDHFVKTTYLMRIPPLENSSTQFTAASKPRKLIVSSELKPPRFKIARRKNTVKINKDHIIFNGSLALLNVSTLTPKTIPTKSEHIINLGIGNSWLVNLGTSLISFEGSSETVMVWKSATVIKPASAKQQLNPIGSLPGALARTAEITSPVLISGTVGTRITSQRFTINIANDGLLAMSSGEDISNWFRPPNAFILNSLPNGLSAKVVNNILDGDASITIEVSGIPTSSMQTTRIAGTIPESYLINANNSIQITPRPDALYYIPQFTNPKASLRNNSITISGRVDNSTPISSSFIIDLENDKFKDVYLNQDVGSDWITNLPDGLSAEITGCNDNSVTIKITGNPTVASSETMALQIPSQFLEISLSSLQVSGGYYSISGAATISDNIVDGRVGLAIDVKQFTINLIGDEFKTNSITVGSNISWFNLPSGLYAKVLSVTENLLEVEIYGTPKVAFYNSSLHSTDITFTIPGSVLVSGSYIYFYSYYTTTNPDARYEIKKDVELISASTVNGNVGIAFENLMSVGKNEALITLQLIGDEFITSTSGGISKTTDVTSWFTNLPDKVTPIIKTVGTSLITFSFTGTPAAPFNESIEISIPGGSFSRDKNPLDIPVSSPDVSTYIDITLNIK